MGAWGTLRLLLDYKCTPSLSERHWAIIPAYDSLREQPFSNAPRPLISLTFLIHRGMSSPVSVG